MRVAVVVLTPRGGLLHYGVQMADGLARRGHEADVLAPRGNELAAHRGPARMRAVLTPPIRSVELPRSPVVYFVRRAAVAARLTRGWAQVNVIARRAGYDAVVIAEDLALTISALAAGALTLAPRRAKIAAVCHNVRPFNRWAGEELFESSAASLGPLRGVYPRFDVVFVHGERSLQEFRRIWPPANLAVIPHGDESIFGGAAPPPSDEERVLFFGDWRKVKGLEVLMRAFELLAERRPDARLTIAGMPALPDFDPDLVRRWAADMGGRVTIVDRYVPVEEVPDVFGSARVVVTPYLVGYQSGVVHLAQTMGRAVVSSDVGDLGAAVRDGETGRLVPPGDVDALADALEAVVADPALAERLGAEGRRRVTTASSWETVADKVVAALDAAPGP
jgi:D-inositol-3-phosphate glycosyltransferase